MPLGEQLENLNIQKILVIAVVYSIINSLMHNTYSFLSESITFEKFQIDSILMFTGDFLGSLLFLFIVSYFRRGVLVFTKKWF
jgi:formate/nitrite transporter FocA (FNT family)